mmetsp:Transcript_2056/g.5759  ORF Transcript_2056/g.5759 Transcript_2056/m.5759 type:complete len:198 (-) Transcript_2056:2764-3357(-)
MSQPKADLGRLAVGCHLQVYWPEYEEWFDAVVKAYRESRHHVLYEDGKEDVGIIDGRNLWLLEQASWTAMKVRWKDDSLHLDIDRSTGEDKGKEEARKEKEPPKQAANGNAGEAGKDDTYGGLGWPATTENATGFMIGCDVCDKWYFGWCVDITEHEAKDIKKYMCPKCVIEGARKRGGKGTNKRMRVSSAKAAGQL